MGLSKMILLINVLTDITSKILSICQFGNILYESLSDNEFDFIYM